MKLFTDLFPIVLFFVAYKWGGSHPEATAEWLNQYLGGVVSGGVVPQSQAPILAATAVTILATLLVIVVERARGKRIETMQWVSLAIITLFGGATLFFHDESFIKWKPSVLYWFMGSALLIGKVILKKNALKGMMGEQIRMHEAIWDKMLWAWVSFFAVMGGINLYVAMNFSTDDWVNFKLFGTLGATVVFIVAQGIAISKHIQQESNT